MEQIRESLALTDRAMHTLARAMTDRTSTAIEEIQSRFARFENRLNIVERVSFDEPAATRRRTGAAPVPEATVPVFLTMAVASGTAAAGGLSDLLQRALNAMPAAVAEEVARIRHIATPAAPEAEGAAWRLPAAPEAEGGSIGQSLEGAINGDKLEQFFVKTATGKTLTIYTDGRENTTSLINKIQAKFPLRAGEEIRLIYEGRQINNTTSVHIRGGTTIYMLMRLRGGMRAPRSRMSM